MRQLASKLRDEEYRLWFERQLSVHGVSVSKLAGWCPEDYDASECCLPKFLRERWPEKLSWVGGLIRWWVKEKNNTPHWDMLTLANLDGAPGVVLVEAKAHREELKPGDHCTSTNGPNRDRIAHRIRQTAKCLGLPIPSSEAALKTDYQLRNRITWALKLARHGLWVALVYIGFTNDPCWPEDPIEKDLWLGHVLTRAAGIIPKGLETDSLDVDNGGKLWFRIVEVPVPVKNQCRVRKGKGDHD